MEKNLHIRIGHLRIIDHLILGYSVFRLQSNGDPLHHSTLENIPMNSWEQICDGLRSGDLHGAFITAPLAMDLFAAGLDISFLMFVHRSGSTMVKNRKAQIKSLADLKGKSILIPHELSVQHMLLHKLLTATGLNLTPPGPTASNQIITEQVPPLLMPHMLENDQDQDIGAYMAPEPYGSEAIARGVGDALCTSDSLWKDHPCCGFVVQNELKSQGKAVEELVGHFFKSAQILDTQMQNTQIQNTQMQNLKPGHPQTDVNLMACAQKFLDQKQEIVKQALSNSGISYTPQKLVAGKKELDIIQTYMTEIMGVMPQTIDLDTFLNPAHAKKALSEIYL